MVLTVQTLSAGSEEAPLAFLSVWSTIAMFAVLVAHLITYLLRHTVERLERFIQGVPQSKYLKHIQGPAVAVILAAVSGYGVNSLTQDTGAIGYIGLLLALPLPLLMVVYVGVHEAHQAEFKAQWPPDSLRAADRVKIRFVLRRVQAEAQQLGTADTAQLDEALRKLLDESLPAVRQRRDRTVRQWLRDHRSFTLINFVWVLVTVCCAAVAVLPNLQDGDWALLRAPFPVAVMVLLIQTGLFVVRRRHSRYRHQALADEIGAVAGGLRRRLTEQRLGLVD